MSAVSSVRVDGPRIAQARRRLTWLVVLGAVVGAISYKLGILAGLGALAAVLAIPLLLGSPRVAFLLWLLPLIVAENTPDWHVSIFSKFYGKTPAYLSPSLLLLLLATAAVLIEISRPQAEPRVPRPFGPALTLVVLAIAFGFANGALGPGIAKSSVLSAVEGYAVLLLPPLVLVNLIRSRDELARLLTLIAALTALKALLGIFAVIFGLTVPSVGGSSLSYLSPATNWLLLLYLLFVAGAAISRCRLPMWMWAATPLVVASFVLGERRSFWLAAVLSLALLALIASGQGGRRLMIPAVGLTALVVYLVTLTGVVGPVQGELVSRATSLTPVKVTTNKEDRYRLAELRSVWPAIERQPVSGLGIGVQWPEISPLPFEYPFNHFFTHVALLYWWMTCGLMGALAYLLLIGTAVITGVRLWRRAGERLERLIALVLGLGWLAMAVVELTTTVLGSDHRGTALLGVSIGVLALIHLHAREAPAPPAALARTWVRPGVAATSGAKMSG